MANAKTVTRTLDAGPFSGKHAVRFLMMALLLCPAPVVSQDGPVVVPDVVYGHKDGMALTMDVFRPSAANGAGVLFMVSGGWVSQWVAPEQAQSRFAFLLDKGFTVFAVRHGSSPRYKVPDAYADVKRAVRYVRLHADEFAVDPARLGVYGGSAGGHLSLMIGLDPDDGDAAAEDEVLRVSSRVAAVVAYFPPVDLRRLAGPSERFPALDFADSLAASVSPILFVSPDDPPTLLMHGDADDLVPIRNSELMFAALKARGVAADYVVFPGAGHGFRGDDNVRGRGLLLAWFEKHLNRN